MAETILVVEDEPDLAQMIVDHLEAKRFRALSCGRVSEAKAKLRNQTFAAILMDLGLQQGSGSDLILAIRRNNKDPNFRTPIIVVSGKVDKQHLDYLRPHINGIVVKPFKVEDISERLFKLLGIKPP